MVHRANRIGSNLAASHGSGPSAPFIFREEVGMMRGKRRTSPRDLA
jgi:hypothetical protein